MKCKWRILAGILCAAFLFTACAGEEREKVKIDKYEEREYQAKLNAVKPNAYGEISNLRLEPGTYISIVGKKNSGEFWKSVAQGAKQAAADINKMMGYKGDDKVKVVFSAPSKQEDIEEQVNILDEELSRNPAVLGIAVIDADACEVQFDLAADNGIPIVMFDSGTSYQNAVCMIGTDNKEAGKTAGNKLGDAIEGEGKVALFMPDSKSTSSMLREEGILEALTKGYENIEVVDSYHNDELGIRSKAVAEENVDASDEENAEGADSTDAADAADTDDADNVDADNTDGTDTDNSENADADTAAEESSDEGTDDTAEEPDVVEAPEMTELEMVKHILESNPDLKGCVAGNESMTKLVLQAAEELGMDDLEIVGFDGGAELMKSLKAGKLTGLVVQNPFGMGYATVVAAARTVLQDANEANVDSGYVWVTKDNMDEKRIKEMLY